MAQEYSQRMVIAKVARLATYAILDTRMLCAAWIALLLALGLGARPAQSAVATFDGLAEGTTSFDFTDGGIRFFNLDCRMGEARPFVIESGSLTDPGFSSTNVLDFCGYAPGPGYSVGRCGQFDMTTDSPATSGSLDLFVASLNAGNSIYLEALWGGQAVASTVITIPSFPEFCRHYTLSVSGVTFDTLRLRGEGPHESGIFLGAVDNVTITPEPATMSLLALGGLAILRRRKGRS